MLRSLYSGISGLKNQQAQMDVISNNIANVNTTGFKSNRMTFADALSETISGARGTAGNFGGANPVQLGRGSVISSVDTIFKQGSLDATGIVTDLAVNGKGFFVVTDGARRYYSRAGALQVQDDGSLMSQGGTLYVMGRAADADGNMPSTTAIDKIVLPFGRKEPAKATSEVEIYCNLDKDSSQVEEWIGGTAFKVDSEPAIGTTDLALTDGNKFHLGDIIEITGTLRDGSKLMAEDNQTWTFTYGEDGTTINDLIAKINEAYNSTNSETGSTCQLDQNGKLRLIANSAGENQTTIFLTPKKESNHAASTEYHESTNSLTSIQPDNINELAEITASFSANDTVDITANGITETFTFGTGSESLQDILDYLNSGAFGTGKYVLQQGTANDTVQFVNISDATDTVVFANETGGAGLNGQTEFTLTASHLNANTSTDLRNLLNMSIGENNTIKIEGTNPDGTYKSAFFKYGELNDGTTIDDLLQKINETFYGVTATITSDGKIKLTDNSSGESYSYIKLSSGTNGGTAAGFNIDFNTEVFTMEDAMTTTGGTVIATGATAVNDLDTTVTNPYQEGDAVQIQATMIDGSTKTVTFTYGATANGYDGTTIQDLIDTINNSNEFPGMTVSLGADGKISFTDASLNDDYNYSTFKIVEWKHADGTDNVGYGLASAFSTNAGTNNSVISLPSFKNETEGETGKHSSTIDVYDNLGQTHKVEINYTQDNTPDSNKWYWEIVVDDGKVVPHSGNSGTVTFNDDGSLRAFLYDNGDSLKFNVGGGGEVDINLNAGNAGSFSGITQLSSPSTSALISQDGYGLGVLNNINVDDQGIISGIYSNGVTKTLAQIAVANFTNEAGLQKEGNSLYSANGSSGDPIVGWAGQNNKTVIKSGYLESSNVDLTDEFAKLIISQRALEANSKVVSTADTILSTIIDRMKRS
jgi:flagellar hook protein FlgE